MNAPLTKEQIALLMSDTMTTRNAAGFAPARSGLFARASAAVTEWLRRRAVVAELQGLSDRELTDIGLVRTDLGRVFDPAFASSRDEVLFRAANG